MRSFLSRFIFSVCLLCSLLVAQSALCAAKFDPARISRTAFNTDLEKKCVFYDFPASGIRFDLFWMDKDQVIWSMPFASVKGWHGYDPRAHPRWHGRALAVFINYPAVPGNVSVPNLGQELAMFAKPQQALTYTANTLDGNTLFGLNTTQVLAGFSIFLSLAAFVLLRKKISVQACVLAGFLPALLVMGVISWAGVGQTVTHLDDNAYLADINKFSRIVASHSHKMGNSTWAFHELPWPYDNQIRYLMADKLKVDTAQAENVFVFENGKFSVRTRGE